MSSHPNAVLGFAAALMLAAVAGAQPLPPLPDLHVRIVNVAPPPLRVETRVTSPGPSHVWVSGTWHWNQTAWGWVPGRWVTRPATSATWVSAEYVRIDGGWKYVPAHWSHQTVIVSDDVRVRLAPGPKKVKVKVKTPKSQGKGPKVKVKSK